MLKRILLIMLIFSVIANSLLATPKVTEVTAKQRFPWNGFVDIKCKVTGIEDSTPCKFIVNAVRSDKGITNKLAQFWVVQNGARQNNFEVTANGEYHLLWDAKAELGSLYCTNMIVSITLKQVPGKVQLWEGGPYWATMNIGAEKPEDSGYYFWWGDTVGYKRENNSWVASDGSNFNFSFYHSHTSWKSNSELQREGWITADGVLAPEHDAATVHWGKGWRLPTKEESDGLVSNCEWIWSTMNGVNGYVVRGKGDYFSNSIFLPCAGTADYTYVLHCGSEGGCWSSVPNPSYLDGAASWYIFFNSSGPGNNSYRNRWNGQTVRPVCGSPNSERM